MPTADQLIDFWKVAGTAAAILLMIGSVGLVHYFKVLLPRAQAETEDQRRESRARVESLQKLADAAQTNAENQIRLTSILHAMQETLRDVKSDVSHIKRSIKSDPDQNVIRDEP